MMYDDVQFGDYEPLWLKGIGKKHPDPVVENASLSAVKAPKPPDDAWQASLIVVKEGKLGEPAVGGRGLRDMCFGKNLEDGSRCFIGDGAGIGKGANWRASWRSSAWACVGTSGFQYRTT